MAAYSLTAAGGHFKPARVTGVIDDPCLADRSGSPAVFPWENSSSRLDTTIGPAASFPQTQCSSARRQHARRIRRTRLDELSPEHDTEAK